VGANNLSQIYVQFGLQPYYFIYLVIIPCIIILFLHLLSTNQKRTQPCHFPRLYKPAAQKVKMVMKNSSTRSFRLCAALVAVPMELCSLPLFRFMRECHTRFLCQNQVLIVCMTQDQLFHTYVQKCSQITKCHK
jgi:hypothetical protein